MLLMTELAPIVRVLFELQKHNINPRYETFRSYDFHLAKSIFLLDAQHIFIM